MRLTSEQLQRYDHDGCLFFEGFFSPAEVELLKERVFSETLLSSPGTKREMLDASVVRMLRGVHREDPLLDRLTRLPRVLGPMRQIAGENVYVYQSRVVVKAGMEDRAFTQYPWHQDFSTWWRADGMKEPRATLLAVFLDDITPCNAPVMVVPGSHRGGMIARSELAPDPMGTGQIVVDAPTMRGLVAAHGLRALTGPAGSAFLMHANLVHASNENISPLRRSILYVVYNALSNECRSTREDYFAPRVAEPLLEVEDDTLLHAEAVGEA